MSVYKLLTAGLIISQLSGFFLLFDQGKVHISKKMGLHFVFACRAINLTPLFYIFLE